MAIKGVVVKCNFRVERVYFSIASDDARIYLDHRSIGFDERAIERLKKRHGDIHLLGGEAQAKGKFSGLKRLETYGWIDGFTQNRFRIILRYFFNLHAAGSTDHENR